MRKRVLNRPAPSESSPRGRFTPIIPGSRRRDFIGGDVKFSGGDEVIEKGVFADVLIYGKNPL